MAKIIEKTCKTILHDVSAYPLEWCIFPHRLTANNYRGCGHGCIYCYVNSLLYGRPRLENSVIVKINAHLSLKNELSKRIRRNKPKEALCLGSISDPYQPAEKEYQITRKMLKLCDELDYPVFIVTKSNLVLRDTDILHSLAQRNLVAVNFTLTPLNGEILSKLEPYAPKNEQRLKAMKELTRNRVPCNIYLSPIFPFLSEKYLENIIEKASKNGAVCCSAIFLKIRPKVWKSFTSFLKQNFPSLINEYEELYFNRGNRDLSKYRLPEYSYRRKIMEQIAKTCSKYDIKYTSEEFFDLWTTPFSDCVNIDCFHWPTSYDFWAFVKAQSGRWVTLNEAVEFVNRNFRVDNHYLQKLAMYWRDGTLFYGVRDLAKSKETPIKYTSPS